MKRSGVVVSIALILLGIASVLVSCGGDDSTTTPPASLAMRGTSGNLVDMNGAWTACFYDAVFEENTRDTLTLSGGSATLTSQVWFAPTDANCTQTATPDLVLTVSATATLGSSATATWTDGVAAAPPPPGIPATANATSAAIVFNAATLTIGSQNYVDFANANVACGRTNWAVNVPQDILNCTDLIQSTSFTEYWVVDDSASPLKWYTGSNDLVPWQVDNFDPLMK